MREFVDGLEALQRVEAALAEGQEFAHQRRGIIRPVPLFPVDRPL